MNRQNELVDHSVTCVVQSIK